LRGPWQPTIAEDRIADLLIRPENSAKMDPLSESHCTGWGARIGHALLLARHTGRRRPRNHDGQVATLHSNIRWCSDGLEFTC